MEGQPSQPQQQKRKRLIESIDQDGSCISEAEFDEETRSQLMAYLRTEPQSIACVNSTELTSVDSSDEEEEDNKDRVIDRGTRMERLIREHKRIYLECKAEGKPVVWIVSRMDLFVLALCQDLDLPLYMGGRQGPSSATVGDCVWLYNWAREKAFCGNVLCGEPIVPTVRHSVCVRCKQVRYCTRTSCSALGAMIHEECCSGSPDEPSQSYFMYQFATVEGEPLPIPLEEYAQMVLADSESSESEPEPEVVSEPPESTTPEYVDLSTISHFDEDAYMKEIASTPEEMDLLMNYLAQHMDPPAPAPQNKRRKKPAKPRLSRAKIKSVVAETSILNTPLSSGA